MKPKDLIKLGIRPGPAIGVALKLLPEAKKALGHKVLEADLKALAAEFKADFESNLVLHGPAASTDHLDVQTAG